VKPALLLCLSVSLFRSSLAAETAEERDFSAEFGAYAGAFALYDGAHQRWLRYHPDECRVRTTPCSTFKVLNALIALETGVASGPDGLFFRHAHQRRRESFRTHRPQDRRVHSLHAEDSSRP
jgi:beta-lactamase class D